MEARFKVRHRTLLEWHICSRMPLVSTAIWSVNGTYPACSTCPGSSFLFQQTINRKKTLFMGPYLRNVRRHGNEVGFVDISSALLCEGSCFPRHPFSEWCCWCSGANWRTVEGFIVEEIVLKGKSWTNSHHM